MTVEVFSSSNGNSADIKISKKKTINSIFTQHCYLLVLRMSCDTYVPGFYEFAQIGPINSAPGCIVECGGVGWRWWVESNHYFGNGEMISLGSQAILVAQCPHQL